jgi:hypothetical protein
MAELTPEERQRIYEEEKARLEAREQIAAEKDQVQLSQAAKGKLEKNRFEQIKKRKKPDGLPGIGNTRIQRKARFVKVIQVKRSGWLFFLTLLSLFSPKQTRPHLFYC